MNEQETLKMLEEWKKTLKDVEEGDLLVIRKADCEEVIILLRSYLMTFDKGGYPFD